MSEIPRPISPSRPVAFFPRLWRSLTEPHPAVTDSEQRREARLLSAVLLSLIVLGIVVESGTTLMLASTGYTGYWTTLGALVWLAGIYVLSRTPRYRLAAVLTVITATLTVFVGGLVEPDYISGGYLDYLMLPIWLAGLFFSGQALLYLILLTLAGLLVLPLLSPAIDLAQVLVGPFTYIVAGAALMTVLMRHRRLTERDRRAELAENEARYRTLVEQLPGITYLDEVDPASPAGFRSLYLSPQFEAWLGYSITEYQQRPALWREIVHPDDRERVLADETFLAAATDEYRLVSRDGQVRWVRDDARVRTDPATGRQLIQGLLLDITGRVEAEQRVRREAARAQALLRVASRLNATLDLDSLLEALCDETRQALNVPSASVWLYDDKQQALIMAAIAGAPSPDFKTRLTPIPRAVHDQAVEKLGPLVVVRDIQAVTPPPGVEVRREDNVRSVAYATMMYEQELIGTLNVVTIGEVRDFDEDERMLLQGLSDQAALAIVNTRLYKDARRRLEHLQALRAIDVAITTNRDLRDTLDVLLDQIIRQLKVDAALVLLLNANGQHLEYASGRGFRTQALQFTRLPLGQGNAGLAAERRAVVAIPDLQGDPQAFAYAPLLATEGFVSYFAAPLIADEQVKGVLEVFHRWPLDPDAEWMAFLEALAGQTAIAIDNTTLFSDLQRTNADLSAAYDATIEGWSRALDLRDRETEGHTRRVTEMTLALARVVGGFSEAELEHLRRGALLHDIGKMGIPDSILLKPGPLTEDEWDVMRRHPAYAYEMLWPIAYLRPALDIPWCHHEKWDGTGYPRALSGAAIPRAARLFAVVDVWDALRSDRPYRAGWPEEKVREHLRGLTGSHFEPEAVDVFLKLIS